MNEAQKFLLNNECDDLRLKDARKVEDWIYVSDMMERYHQEQVKKLTTPYVSSSFSIEFAQYIAENHYKLVNVENGKYYWKNETHLKTSKQLMKTFKDTIGFK